MEFIARQPILDAQQNVVAYELLFRESYENRYTGTDHDLSSKMTMATAMLVGLDVLSVGRDVYLNCTEQLVLGNYPTLFPAATTVIELLETVEPSQAVIDSCTRLKAAGYRIALDDFEDRPGYGPLIALADIIKVDFRLSDHERRVDLARRYQRGRLLLAEKVETHQEFIVAKEVGYSLFQGFFFCRPKILTAQNVEVIRPQHLHFLNLIKSSDLNFAEIERAVKSEPSVCYRLLRYMNSAAFAFRGEIRSILQALTLLGEIELRKFLLLICTVLSGGIKKPELVSAALVRARFAELLAVHFRLPASELFILGLLSLMDAILECPIATIAEQVAVPVEVRSALLGEASPFRTCFNLVLAYEAADWTTCDSICDKYDIDAGVLGKTYLEALGWTKALTSD